MSKENTLINVDDHEAARYARHRILTGAGFRVLDAATGQETLDLVDANRPDLVLLDIHLPDFSGIEVCRRLRETPHGSGVAVLQISASAVTPHAATTALDNGADGYLSEPVDPDVLVATVRSLLRMRQAEKALAEANARLEAANRELLRSNEDLQQFAFVASHDLQEPLRTVTTFVQLIEQEARDRLTDVEREYFEHVIAGANRMRLLINDLLAYSQVGREDQKKSLVSLSAIVSWAIDNLGPSVKQASATIHIREPLPKVWGDFAQLGQVIQNLLSNALKYRKPNQPLQIEIWSEERPEGACVIGVKDNGVGIAPDYHERIFVPFKRLHGPEIPGTGIGLAVCRRIVDAHQGRLWVESDVDGGAAFFVQLPCEARP